MARHCVSERHLSRFTRPVVYLPLSVGSSGRRSAMDWVPLRDCGLRNTSVLVIQTSVLLQQQRQLPHRSTRLRGLKAARNTCDDVSWDEFSPPQKGAAAAN